MSSTRQARNLGILASMFASICCLGPLILVLVGLGGLGITAVIGKYHWWFLGGGILLIIIAWSFYFRKKKACDLKSCQMEDKPLTQIILTLATLIVVFFGGLNLYTSFWAAPMSSKSAPVGNIKTVIIPVEGMTCITCELTVTHALKKVEGVIEVSVSFKEKMAKVSYNPEKTDISQLVEVINKTGYSAKAPE